MRIIEWLIHRPFVPLLGIVFLVLGGLYSFNQMPVGLFPSFNYPLINIVTHYPAGTAKDVEALITRPIENSVQSLQGLQRVHSISTSGFSQVTVEFTWGTDVLVARQLVSSALAQVSPLLPPGATPKLENIGTSLDMVSTYTITGGGNPVALRSWVQYVLSPALTALPGVAFIQVMGGGQAALRIDVNPLQLKAHHLTLKDISTAIQHANVIGTGGFIETHGRDHLINIHGQIRTIQDLKQVLISKTASGMPVTLSDVATIYAGALPERYTITQNRLPAIAFLVQKQSNANTLSVSREVGSALAHLTPPGNAQIEKFYDQADIIGLAYRNMRTQLVLGAILAVLTLFLVLGRSRTTWIVAISIPLSVIGAFIIIRLAGFGINLMTLGAITVTIGLINDDAVIVLENIFRHRQLGKDPLRATLEGTREILAADTAGTLTVLAAFVPLVLLSGLAGRLFLPFGLSFAFVLLLSLLFSVTLIPWATARWLPPANTVFKPSNTVGSRWIAWVGSINRRVLDYFLKHQRRTVVIATILMLGSLTLLVFNPARFLPLLDENSLLLSYQLAPGTSLSESDNVGNQLEALVLKQPGVEAVFRRTGSPESSFFVEGPDEGELILRLDTKSKFDALEIAQALNTKLATLPGILFRINEPTSEKLDESFSGLPALFGITLYGNDLSMLHDAANRVEASAKTIPGLSNVINSVKMPVDTLNVDIDRRACARFDVAPQTVAEAIQTAMQGMDVTQSLVDGQVLHIYVRNAPAARRNVIDLKQVLVHGANDTLIPVAQLARIQPASTFASIEHQFGTRVLTLTADISGNPFVVIARLNAAIKQFHLPPDIRVAYTGEYQQLTQTLEQVAGILVISALLVYAIIAIQLGNLLDPFVVLIKLPIDIMGAALALFITHHEIDFTVLIGFITLVGVAVNNGIVLLSYTKQLRLQGYDAVNAVHEAVNIRLRPLLLTQMTAVIALIPASLGIGSGPQLLQSLAIMMFGGLTVGTFLTLNLIPVFYVATERWRN